MSTLSRNPTVLLRALRGDVQNAASFRQLCGELAPIVDAARIDDGRTNPLGVPVLLEGDRPPSDETCAVLAMAWIDALSMSERHCGRGYLSDLDADLLPIAADLRNLFAVGLSCGFDEDGTREIFRQMKRHMSGGLPLPRSALRLLKATGFFSTIAHLPLDLFDALEENDRAYAWTREGLAYVLCGLNGRHLAVDLLVRESVDVETGPMEAPAPLSRKSGWTRERAYSFRIPGGDPSRYPRIALREFRSFIMRTHRCEPELFSIGSMAA